MNDDYYTDATLNYLIQMQIDARLLLPTYENWVEQSNEQQEQIRIQIYK